MSIATVLARRAQVAATLAAAAISVAVLAAPVRPRRRRSQPAELTTLEWRFP